MPLRSLAGQIGKALPLPPNTLRSIVRQRVLRLALANAVPFNQALGIEIVDIGDRHASVRLPEDDRLLNHVGTQHAGALFTAGEWATGIAMSALLGDRVTSSVLLAERAEIAYRAPASGPIVATARPRSTDVLERLDADGRVRVTVDAGLVDRHGTVVAEMSVDWYAKPRGTRRTAT
jgi:uncharacterized protein (TIGR00369 family)